MVELATPQIIDLISSLSIYIGIGVVAGLLAGLFGIGGGLIIIPLLLIVFAWQNVADSVAMHLAIGTSLATIIFTSAASVTAHHALGGVRWDTFRPMVCGILAGAVLGVFTAVSLSGDSLKLIVGGFALVMAVTLLLGVKPKPGRELPATPGLLGAGSFIGWASAIFGIGGGAFSVPFLVWHNVRMQEAVATSAAFGLPIAIAGAFTNVYAGWGEEALPKYAVGFVYLPALAGIIVTSMISARYGARLAHRLPATLLSRLFGCMLIVIGTRLLIDGLR